MHTSPSPFTAPELAWLRKRLRQALERDAPLPAVAQCKNPSQPQWDATNALLGRPASLARKSLRVPTEELERRIIELGLGSSLRGALEAADGPIVSRETEARRDRMLWRSLVADLRDACSEIAAVESTPDAAALKALCQRDHDLAAQLISEIRHVSTALQSGVAVPELAARTLGDSHALDRDTLRFRLLARLADLPDAHPQQVWAAYGVSLDSVSSAVLVLNLRFCDSPLADAMNQFTADGEPHRVLLRHLPKLTVAPLADLYICENPAVLEAAADRLGAACPPLLCTEGQPSLACQQLLTSCAAAGARVHYHGDFDWGGVRIANTVHRLVPDMLPWHFDTNSYNAITSGGTPLNGSPADAAWDPALRPAMTQRALAFHEEQVLDLLLQDLAPDGLQRLTAKDKPTGLHAYDSAGKRGSPARPS